MCPLWAKCSRTPSRMASDHAYPFWYEFRNNTLFFGPFLATGGETASGERGNAEDAAAGGDGNMKRPSRAAQRASRSSRTPRERRTWGAEDEWIMISCGYPKGTTPSRARSGQAPKGASRCSTLKNLSRNAGYCGKMRVYFVLFFHCCWSENGNLFSVNPEELLWMRRVVSRNDVGIGMLHALKACDTEKVCC